MPICVEVVRSTTGKELAFDWTVASYMLLIGLAGSLFVLTGSNYLFLGDAGPQGLTEYNGYVSFAAAVIGLGFVQFHLGQKSRFLRVFSRPTSIVTITSTLIGAFTVIVLVYSAYWFIPALLAPFLTLRPIISAIGLILGIATSILPGLELASLKARPFWRSPLVVAFLTLSSYALGFAVGGIVLAASSPPTFVSYVDQALVLALALQMILVLTHLAVQPRRFRAAANPVSLLVRGGLRSLFWGGVIVVGCVIPLLLFLGGDFFPIVLARSTLILVGGISLRYSVIVAGLVFPGAGVPSTVSELRRYLGYAKV